MASTSSVETVTTEEIFELDPPRIPPPLTKSPSTLNDSDDSMRAKNCSECGMHCSFMMLFLAITGCASIGIGLLALIWLLVDTALSPDTHCFLQGLVVTLIVTPIGSAITWIVKDFADAHKKKKKASEILSPV